MAMRSQRLSDVTAGICCFALILVPHEYVDLVSTHLFGTIADTAYHHLLHDEMGHVERNVPMTPTLPRAINRGSKVLAMMTETP